MANKTGNEFRQAIERSTFSIYDPIQIGDPDLWIPSPTLQRMLNDQLSGRVLPDLPIRTRSKIVKEWVCEALGYPKPQIFRKTKPRFPGQNFDTYTQQSNNLQIWNEEIAPSRRYVMISVTKANLIAKVRVVTGDVLAKLDTTGKLTKKHQARLTFGVGERFTELVSPLDTERVISHVIEAINVPAARRMPTDDPEKGRLLSIAKLFQVLSQLVGSEIVDPGIVQERNRAAVMHRAVCRVLGYSEYADSGQFPDVRHQLLEVKLQTSPTIDLGLVAPNSTEPLDVPQLTRGEPLRHCDVRYALFYGQTDGSSVRITRLFLTTGKDFFGRFPQFQGLVINAKLQIPLPRDFWER